MMTDRVSLIKKDGEKIDNIKASVQSKKIYIMQSDILIEADDLIQRKMSNGAEETYKVIDPGFHEKLHRIPAGYQIVYKKLGLPEAKRAVQNITTYNTINIHGDNQGIASSGNNNTNNNSEFNQKFTQLIQEIQNSDIGNKTKIIQELNEKKEDKKALQIVLGTLLTKGAEVATIYPSIVSFLSMLG